MGKEKVKHLTQLYFFNTASEVKSLCKLFKFLLKFQSLQKLVDIRFCSFFFFNSCIALYSVGPKKGGGGGWRWGKGCTLLSKIYYMYTVDKCTVYKQP